MMDDKMGTGTGTGMSNGTGETERSAEEKAWDEEFRQPKNDIVRGVGELAKLAVQIPVTIIQMPFRLIPEETTNHGRAAVREGFLAFRSLLGALGDGIERILADPTGEKPEGAIPDGTWGPPRRQTPAAGGKARRIELGSDESPPDIQQQAKKALADEVEEVDKELGEGRGLRSDIEY
jgi:hypothetical protein